MKTYKLIKIYPGSPDVGFISKPKEDQYHYWNHCWFVPSDYPEFWEEIKKPLFTTEDGVDKFEGDQYYFIVVHEGLPVHLKIQTHVVDWSCIERPPLGCVQFHNLKMAERYVDFNKLLYSKQQILDICGKKDFIGTKYLKDQLNII